MQETFVSCLLVTQKNICNEFRFGEVKKEPGRSWCLLCSALKCEQTPSPGQRGSKAKEKVGDKIFSKHRKDQKLNDLFESFKLQLTFKWEGERTPSSFCRSLSCIVSWSSRKVMKKLRAVEITQIKENSHNHVHLANSSNKKHWAAEGYYEDKLTSHLLVDGLLQQDPWSNE